MTAPAEPSSSPAAAAARNSAPLPVNDLARSYQPRRVWAAGISIAWNLVIAALFVGTGAAERLYKHFVPLDPAYFPAAFSTSRITRNVLPPNTFKMSSSE